MKKSAEAKAASKAKKSTAPVSEIKKTKEILAKSASVEEWKKEIRRILNGERDGYLKYRESVKIYIEDELFPALEQGRDVFDNTYQLFIKALNETVKEWNPSLKREKEYFACLLELIQVYEPEKGFEKTWEFLQFWEQKTGAIQTFGGYKSESEVDLIQEALFALNKYFPIAPRASDEDYKRFKTYLRTLEKYLFAPEYGGHSAIRLLGLNEYDLQDSGFKEIIRDNPLILEDLCSYVFSPDEKLELESNITEICKHVFTINEEIVSYFDKYLDSFDAKIDYEQLNPTVVLANGKRFTVDLLDADYSPISGEKVQSIKKIIEYTEKWWVDSKTDDLVELATLKMREEEEFYE